MRPSGHFLMKPPIGKVGLESTHTQENAVPDVRQSSLEIGLFLAVVQLYYCYSNGHLVSTPHHILQQQQMRQTCSGNSGNGFTARRKNEKGFLERHYFGPF
jgi:hypothetical protein